MELGCGVRAMTVKGREYLYVWHYESRGGRRKQMYDYVGPAGDPDARRRAGEALARKGNSSMTATVGPPPSAMRMSSVTASSQ